MNIFKRIRFQWQKHQAIKAAIRAHEADGRKYYFEKRVLFVSK